MLIEKKPARPGYYSMKQKKPMEQFSGRIFPGFLDRSFHKKLTSFFSDMLFKKTSLSGYLIVRKGLKYLQKLHSREITKKRRHYRFSPGNHEYRLMCDSLQLKNYSNNR